MLVKTSTQHAPWCLVEGNDKNWARVKVLAKMVEILSRELDYEPADPLKHGGKKASRTAKPAKAGEDSQARQNRAGQKVRVRG